MAIGIAILAHKNLRRTIQLARYLAAPERKLAIHIDRRTPDKAIAPVIEALGTHPDILLIPRLRCEWGRFSLVRAGLNAAEALLDHWPDLTHVVQISGACLPVRPRNELSRFLAQHENTDFVEHSPVEDEAWVRDGLSRERTSLYHPFSFIRQRWLFDRCVDLQRRLGINRTPPPGIELHHGSQWWCLSAPTLRGILNDPRRAEFDRFFALSWIPDESYVPSLVHRHSQNVRNRALTLSQFGPDGQPHIFYDDHLEALEAADAFFARKIWPGASGLYQHFLSTKRRAKRKSTAIALDALFDAAETRTAPTRPGRLNAGRYIPAHALRTCRAYGVFIGFDALFPRFDRWLGTTTGALAHGRVFDPGRLDFTPQFGTSAPGGLAANPAIRDLAPEQFLINLLLNSPDRPQSMSMSFAAPARMTRFITVDPNAKLFVIRGAWLIELARCRDLPPEAICAQAQTFAEAEEQFCRALTLQGRRDVLVASLEQALIRTTPLLDLVRDRIRPGVDLLPGLAPELADLTGLRAFADALDANGVDVSAAGRLTDPAPQTRTTTAPQQRWRA